MAEVLPYVRALALTGTLLLGSGALAGCGAETDLGNREEAATAAADVDAGAPTEEEQEACAKTWAMPGLPRNEASRVIMDGIPELGDAANEDEARDAIGVWSEVISRDDGVLADYAKQIIEKEIPKDELVDEEGCATELADDVRTAMEVELSEAEISDGSVPAPLGMVNSGFDGERVFFAERAGVSGDTMGVSLTLKDGRRVHIMKRCGNLGIVSGPVYLPPGKTDEPEQTPPGVTPKNDRHTTPAGVPGQNRGSGTAPSGPTGPGKGPAGQKPNEQGYVEGELVVTAPVETVVTSDPDGETTPPPNDGAETGNPGGNGSPTVDVDDGGTGSTQTGEQGGGGGAGSQDDI
ncbi:hypothetical protein EKI60_02940 [Candidatus Saccharibacteria bacterium]|nr:MAG: hypothetical protein EKI60_02940 [Candidatus Saccharibacteria bacterium]